MLIEVCANSLQSARNAAAAGADRIELCCELATGGITPSYGMLRAVREAISIPVYVLIRPRSGDFTYSDIEFDIMLRDIECCKELGFEGIVSGVLRSDFTLDAKRTAKLIEAAAGASFTFHRAFDWLANPIEELGTLEKLGVRTILTSGQKASAMEGLALLMALHRRAKECTIMPGGGISPSNIDQFIALGFPAVHLSGTSPRQTLPRKPPVTMNAPTLLFDDTLMETDSKTIRELSDKLK